MNEFQRQVRAAVIQSLRDTARAPAAGEIAASLGTSSADVSAALHALAGAHRLVLMPGTDLVRMAHPFSAVATDFVVKVEERQWYANCVWDGLAILALLGDGVLDTHSPATGAPIRLQASAGQVSGAALVHFLVPMPRLWDDIVFTWANIAAFRSEGELQDWLAAQGYASGAVVDPQTLFELGRDWYRTRLDVAWQPATASEATALFGRHGLVGKFWSLV